MTDFSYDQVPYTSYPFPQTHPDRMATIATISGMTPTPIDRCRVLEFGCGDGSNLFPMAEALPHSEFIGIDLAESAIKRGQTLNETLQLDNLTLLHQDILQVDESLGKFDYIIAHGIYSWIPTPVRNRLMELCRHLLTEHGVAYISYNAYPGFYLRQIPRDMMRLHTRNISDPLEKVDQGLALLQLITKRFPSQEEARKDLYGHLILENLGELQDYLHKDGIYHDMLADENTPVYFYQFASHAAQYGLQYLSEAEFSETQEFFFPAEVREILKQFEGKSVILKEQYMDYLKCRIFRQTLLCRQEHTLDRSAKPEILTRFFLSTKKLQTSPTLTLAPGIIEEFKISDRTRLETDFPLAKAALLELSRISPQSITFEALTALAAQRLASDTSSPHPGVLEPQEIQTLREVLYSAYGADVVQLQTRPLPVAAAVASHPETTALARWQAERETIITNLLHSSIDIESAVTLQLIRLLDGRRDHAELLEALLASPAAAELSDEKNTSPEPAQRKAQLADKLEEILENLRIKALLKASE